MSDLRELLLKDYDHFSEALFRNEDIGEKRLNFLLTLVTAVTAGLVALSTASNPPAFGTLNGISTCAVGFLLIIGVLTQLRIRKRDRVSDEYKAILTAIRSQLADPSTYLVADLLRPTSGGRSWRRLPGAGYAQTTGAINLLLLVALIYLWSR